jgi:hypothetical protein
MTDTELLCTDFTCLAIAQAKFAVIDVLPTPPFIEITAITGTTYRLPRRERKPAGFTPICERGAFAFSTRRITAASESSFGCAR